MSSSTAVATFSGMGSGLPVDQLIEATMAQNSTRLNKYQEDQTLYTKQKSAYSTIKTKYSSFDSALQKVIDSKLIYAYDLFDRKSVDISDKSVATVSTGKGAVSGSTEIKVNSLATPAQVSLTNLGSPISSGISLNDIGVIDGSFALSFIKDDGTAVNVSADVTIDDTIDSYMAKLNKALLKDSDDKDTGLSGSISYNVDANGVFTLDFSTVEGGVLNPKNPYPKSKSNFADVFGFTQNAGSTTLTSKPVSSLNLDGKISDNSIGLLGFDASTLTLPETINIGGLDIEVTADTTLRQIMNKVNEESDCQVKMGYNQTTNTMTIKGKDDFYSDNIFFSGKALLSGLGLTDENGVVKTEIQTQRKAGEIVVDGKTIAIRSNKVTAADTGLTGVTINLKSVTPSDEPLTISISDNTDDLTNALQAVVDAYNAIVTSVDGYTYVDTSEDSEDTSKSSGILSNDYTIKSMQTTMSMMMMTPVDSKLTYKSLSLIGFSTSDGKLALDKTKFLNALSDNPTDVKTLLVGTKDKTVTGVFENLKAQIKQYMDYDTGFFATKSNSLTSSIDNLNKSIEAEQRRLDAQRTSLVKQYSNLDAIMSKYQAQSASFSS